MMLKSPTYRKMPCLTSKKLFVFSANFRGLYLHNVVKLFMWKSMVTDNCELVTLNAYKKLMAE